MYSTHIHKTIKAIPKEGNGLGQAKHAGADQCCHLQNSMPSLSQAGMESMRYIKAKFSTRLLTDSCLARAQLAKCAGKLTLWKAEYHLHVTVRGAHEHRNCQAILDKDCGACSSCFSREHTTRTRLLGLHDRTNNSSGITGSPFSCARARDGQVVFCSKTRLSQWPLSALSACKAAPASLVLHLIHLTNTPQRQLVVQVKQSKDSARQRYKSEAHQRPACC